MESLSEFGKLGLSERERERARERVGFGKGLGQLDFCLHLEEYAAERQGANGVLPIVASPVYRGPFVVVGESLLKTLADKHTRTLTLPAYTDIYV